MGRYKWIPASNFTDSKDNAMSMMKFLEKKNPTSRFKLESSIGGGKWRILFGGRKK
tara:strand:+ start:409 stop:576 length:168 start_codon:yes stop_codon:yes gene_type:complete